MWPLCMQWRGYHSGLDSMLQLENRLLQKPDVLALLKEDYREWPGYSILYLQVGKNAEGILE